MWFSLLILQMSTPESIRGKWFVQACYVMVQCQSMLTRILAFCSAVLGLFSETTWEKTNSPSTWQPFKYLVTVLLYFQVFSSSGYAGFHWSNTSIVAELPDSSPCSIFSRSVSYCQFSFQPLVSGNEYVTPGYISKIFNDREWIEFLQLVQLSLKLQFLVLGLWNHEYWQIEMGGLLILLQIYENIR